MAHLSEQEGAVAKFGGVREDKHKHSAQNLVLHRKSMQLQSVVDLGFQAELLVIFKPAKEKDYFVSSQGKK